jgi:hypothetical protein
MGIPGHIVCWLEIKRDQYVALPDGALLTGEGWRLTNGSLYVAVSLPRGGAAPKLVDSNANPLEHTAEAR